MKKLAVFLIAASALVSGCVVYDTPYQDRQYREDYQRDRSHDGVPHHGDRDRDRDGDGAVSYTHLTLPTSDLV